MKFETITVNEYYGNNLEATRQARIFTNGTLEYLPEPDYLEDEEFEEPVFEEDEEELGCITS